MDKNNIKNNKKFYRHCVGYLSALASGLLVANLSLANPEGGVVVPGSGHATINQGNGTTTISQSSQKAIINWQKFNINAGEQTVFQQPNAQAITLNRVNPKNGMSSILGNLKANGQVWLVNPAGIFFGKGAVVDVAGLLATTADIKDEDFMAGNYRFMQSPDWNGSIVNEGKINVADHGLVALVAPGVVNRGLIKANFGKVVLGAGTIYTVDLYGDQLINFAAGSEIKKAGVDEKGQKLIDAIENSGTIIANGGKVLLTGQAAKSVVDNVINMKGIIEAKSASIKNGEIILSGGNEGVVRVSGKLDVSGQQIGEKGGKIVVTGQNVGLFDNAQLNASGHQGGGEILIGGDYQGKNSQISNAENTYVSKNTIINNDALINGNGGKTIIWSNNNTNFYGNITALGGNESGNGGFVEVSGKNSLAFAGKISASAIKGALGTIWFDPKYLIIQNSGGSNYQDGVNNIFSADPTSTNILTADSINALTANVILQANTDITVNDAINIANPGTTLTMQAGRSILINNNITTNNATINLSANDPNAQAANRDAGAGNITIASGKTISSGTGDINLLVNNSSAAGNITAANLTTTSGNIIINSPLGINLTGAINSTSGSVAVNANTAGIGANNINLTGSITTGNATANAVSLNVNNAVGGAGGVILGGNITTGNGGNIIIVTNTGGNATGGSITRTAGTLNSGVNGSVVLMTPTINNSSIGTNAANIVTATGTVDLSVGSGGAFINNTGNLLLTAPSLNANSALSIITSGTLTLPVTNINTGTGALILRSNGGVLAINGNLQTTTGAINLFGASGLTINNLIQSTSGAITLGTIPSTTVGDIVINNAIATAGNLTISNSRNLAINNNISANNIAMAAQQAVNQTNANINATGTVTINANQGAGANSFTMTNSNISTTNATANAVRINVNNGGGTGGANLGNITVGNNGTLTVSTANNGTTSGGSITQNAGTQLTAAGTGSVTLTVPTTSNAGVTSTIAGGNLNLTAGKQGANINSNGNLVLTGATLNPRASLTLNATTALTINSAINTGVITLLANSGITIANSVVGFGPMVINANNDNNTIGTLTVNNGATLNSSGYDMAITARDIALNGTLNSGAGLMTITANGAGSSIGLGTGVSPLTQTMQLSSAELNNITATGARVFNAGFGIRVASNYNSTGALTFNADTSNTGSSPFTLDPNASINTNNNPLNISAGALNSANPFGVFLSPTSTLNASTITLTASGASNTMTIGTFGDYLPASQIAYMNAPNIIFNATNGIIVSRAINKAANLTFNADLDNDGGGLFQLLNGGANSGSINSLNNSLGIIAGTLDLQTGTLNSGTGAFSLTATGAALAQPSLSIGDTVPQQGIIHITSAQYANQIMSTGARTLNGKDGISIYLPGQNVANNQALTLNADFNGNGVGTLLIGPNQLINTNGNILNITAAQLSIDPSSTFTSGAFSITGTAAPISPNGYSLGIGDGAGGQMQISTAQWTGVGGTRQFFNNGPLTFNGYEGVSFGNLPANYNLANNNALTINADFNNSGTGNIHFNNSNLAINSNNNAINIIAGGGSLNNNTLMHGTGAVIISGTSATSPSLGLGDGAGGQFNLSNTEMNSIYATGTGALIFNGNNGVNINYNFNSGIAVPLTFNADLDNNGVGTLNVLANRIINSNNQAINITAADINLPSTSSINSGTNATTINATGSIGLGTATGTMTLSNAELARILAGILNLNTSINSITSSGVTAVAVANLPIVNLNAQGPSQTNTSINPNTLNSEVIFNNGTSNFRNLNVVAASGIQLNSGITATGAVVLGQGADSGLNDINLNNGNQTVSAANGITINNDTQWSSGTTLSLVSSGSNINIASNVSLGNGRGNLNLTANDLNLQGIVNLGTAGNLTITGNGSIGIGAATGQTMTLNGATLQKMTANNLTVNAGNNSQILVDNVTTTNALNNFNGNVSLVATNGTTGSVTFQNNASNFKNALSVTADNGININTNVVVGTNLSLTGVGTGNITQAAGTTIASTNASNTLSATTGSGTANLIGNGNNSFTNLTANSTSGTINYTNIASKSLILNTSNVGTGTLSVTTQGTGGITQANSSTTIAGDNLIVTTGAGNATLTNTNNNFNNLTANSTSGTINYTNLNNKNLNLNTSNVGTGNLTLTTQGTGKITQSAASTITGNNLTIITNNGSAILTNAGNSFNNLSGNSTSGTINYTNANNKDLNLNTSNVGAGNLNIITQGTGALTQSGSISGNNLSVTTNTGNATLTNPNNSFNNLTANSTSGAIAYTNATDKDLNVNSSNVSAGSLSLTTQGIGNISQSGILTGDTLNITTGAGNATLNLNNSFNNLSGNSTSGTINYTNANNKDLNLSTSNVGAGNLNIITQGTGALTQSGSISGNNLTVKTNTGNVILTNQNNSFNNLTANSNSGSVSYTNGLNKDLNVNASNVGTGNLTLTTQGTGNITQAGVMIGNNLAINTGSGNATLNTANNQFNNLTANSTSGVINYLNNNALLMNASNVGTGGLNVATNTGDIQLLGGLLGNQIGLTAQNGGIDLNYQDILTPTNSGVVSLSALGTNQTIINHANLVGNTLNIVTNGGSATLNGNFAQLSVATNSGDFSYQNSLSRNLQINQAILGAGNLTLTTLGTGGMTQAGPMLGNQLTLLADNGDINLNGTNNNFNILQITTQGGNANYVNQKNLNLLSSSTGVGNLRVETQGASDLDVQGDQSAKNIILVAGNNLALHANSYNSTSGIGLTAGNNITGESLENFPKLNAPIIQIKGGGKVADPTAPIGLNVTGLTDSSYIIDASGQTRLGVNVNYNEITSQIVQDDTNQYYLYPLLKDLPPPPPSPPGPPTPALTTAEKVAQIMNGNNCMFYYQINRDIKNYVVLPNYCYQPKLLDINREFSLVWQ